ncbi:hypothetical protein IMSAG049_00507 [Clostridiales bacterium]|nr:hypothetical protein IMSAG049_00507 [Clostridiales bacterium]
MKKIFVFVTAAVLMMTSGCSTSKKKNSQITAIAETTSAVDDYEGITNISFSAVSEGVEMEMGTTGAIALQTYPFFADIDISIYSDANETGPEQTNSRIILEAKDGVNTIYLLQDGTWNSEKIESNKFRTAASQYDVTENGRILLEATKNIQNTGSEEYNGITANKYSGTIPKDTLPNILESTGSLSLVGTNIGRNYYRDCKDLPVDIWVDSGNVIVGYRLDLTETVQNLFNALFAENNVYDEAEIVQFNSYIAEGSVSTYNKGIEAVLPAEAQNTNDN